jgi:hypothetical protein
MHFHQAKRQKKKSTNQQRKSKRQAIRQSVIQSANEPDKKKQKKIVAYTNSFLLTSFRQQVQSEEELEIGPSRVERSTVGVPALAP